MYSSQRDVYREKSFYPVQMMTKDILCFSDERWTEFRQRPKNLIDRVARKNRVFFFEEAVFHDDTAELEIRPIHKNLLVAVPKFPWGSAESVMNAYRARFIDQIVNGYNLTAYVCWYYSADALNYTRHLDPSLCIYDCSHQTPERFYVSEAVKKLRSELERRADIVFSSEMQRSPQYAMDFALSGLELPC